MKIMVTGGTSFIGSYVVRRLAEEGHDVTVLARNPAKVPGLCSLASVTFRRGTLTSEAAVTEALRGQEACIHIALSWGDSAVAMAESDTLPAIGIFQAAADLGVRHLIYTSSVAVFDTAPGRFSDVVPPRPARYYGATKAATEVYLALLRRVRTGRTRVDLRDEVAGGRPGPDNECCRPVGTRRSRPQERFMSRHSVTLYMPTRPATIAGMAEAPADLPSLTECELCMHPG
jgi:nucleoside-diphosphate-sugar epimerase